MPRRLVLPVVLALAVLAAALGAVALAAPGGPPDPRRATVPPGPRIAIVVWPSATGDPEIRTIGPTGGDPRTLLVASTPLIEGGIERPIWSPDGEALAFVGYGRRVRGVYVMGADGSTVRRLPNSESPGGKETVLVSEPVFDPTSGSLTADITNRHNWNSLWSLPVDGSAPHRLSPWVGDRYLYPYSAAPDGRLAAQAAGASGFAIATLDPDGGALRVLVGGKGEGNFDPAISPDGAEIAYLVDHFRQPKNGNPRLLRTDLMLMPIDGGRSKRLAAIPGGALWTSWDPSGSRISFTAEDLDPSSSGGVSGRGASLMEINADGTCLRTIYKAKGGGAVFGGAWQPGEGRGAGPLSC